MSDNDDKYRVEVFSRQNLYEKADLDKVTKAKVVQLALQFQEQGREMEQRGMQFRKKNADLTQQRDDQAREANKADARTAIVTEANAKLRQIIGRIIDSIGDIRG
jgi:hypothetical protein